jgi:rhamnulokinase
VAEGAARIAAIDLGASSGRVIAGHGTEQGFTLREIHRFPNRPRLVDGVLRWDARALFAGILHGLRAAADQAGPIDAVSVDGWAVDYGLLDHDGDLIADPASYRDTRTGPPFAAVTGTPGGVAGVDAARLYEATGIAVQPINTVFQLMAERESAQLGTARYALLVPDLMTYWLSGQLRDAVRLAGRPVNTVHVNGGGVANPLFCQLVANACGLPTVAGPTEAASWGNALVQARALGVVGGSLPELRSFVRRSVHLTRYEPDEQEAAWERADEVVLASRAPVPRSRPCSQRGETVS